jgi:hypothetical protein
MATRKGSPFREQKRRLPHKALVKREDPFRKVDQEEFDAACKKIAQGMECLCYAGSRAEENGCKVICFDTPEKARAMQAWIDASGIANRSRPEPPPNYPQLKVGSH